MTTTSPHWFKCSLPTASTTVSVYWPSRQRRRQPSCNVFSTQLHESCQTVASSIEEWPISGGPFCTGWMSLTGLGSGCAFRCTSVDTINMAPGYLIDLCQPVASIDGHGHLWSASRGQLQIPRIKMATYGNHAFGHAGPSTWNALPNTLKCSLHCIHIFRSHLKHFAFRFTSASRLLQLTCYTGWPPKSKLLHFVNIFAEYSPIFTIFHQRTS